MIIPLGVHRLRNTDLFQKVIGDLCAAKLQVFVERQFHVLSEPRAVVIPNCFGVPERLKNLFVFKFYRVCINVDVFSEFTKKNQSEKLKMNSDL